MWTKLGTPADYVVTNGFIEDNRVLQEDPFRTVGSIVELFKDKMDDARRIMGIIADIKRNSEEVV
jgi:type I restriction enzyme, R subunit